MARTGFSLFLHKTRFASMASYINFWLSTRPILSNHNPMQIGFRTKLLTQLHITWTLMCQDSKQYKTKEEYHTLMASNMHAVDHIFTVPDILTRMFPNEPDIFCSRYELSQEHLCILTLGTEHFYVVNYDHQVLFTDRLTSSRVCPNPYRGFNLQNILNENGIQEENGWSRVAVSLTTYQNPVPRSIGGECHIPFHLYYSPEESPGMNSLLMLTP